MNEQLQRDTIKGKQPIESLFQMDLKLNQRSSPGQTDTETAKNDFIAGGNSALIQRIFYGNRNGSGNQISHILQVAKHLFLFNFEDALKGIQGHIAGLMKDKQINVINCQPVFFEKHGHLFRNLRIDKRQNPESIHMNIFLRADIAAFILHGS